MQTNYTIDTAGGILIGAGLAKLEDLNVAMILIGTGCFLKILVVVLNKFGIPVQSSQD